MLEIKEVSFSYKNDKEQIPVLGPIDYTLGESEICAIIGPSGCGKSTLLHIMAGLLKKTTGEVLLNGAPLNTHKDLISFVPQNLGLLPWKTVKENCLLPLTIKKEKLTSEIEDRMQSICKRLNIEELMNRYPNDLSGGQKQRVALARSFIMKADLLLMDEPFSALDASIKEEAMTLFLELWQTYQTPTLFVTHHVDEALYIGQQIMMMGSNPGRITKIIPNPLFKNASFKEDPLYGDLVHKVQSLIRKEWGHETV